MDKTSNIDSGYNHSLSIAERKSIVLTGVKKIESFDSEEFLMDTTLGYLNIKGSDKFKAEYYKQITEIQKKQNKRARKRFKSKRAKKQ